MSSSLDPAESSHWRSFHSNFAFSGSGFSGLKGFGDCEKPYRGVRAALHYLLQSRFRRFGASYPEFCEIERRAKEITSRQNRALNLDVLRQILTLGLLKQKLSACFRSQNSVCVIGDGFASMTTLLLSSTQVSQLIIVNLTKTLLVDLWYLKLWLGPARFASTVDLVTSQRSLSNIISTPLGSGQTRVVAIEGSNHALLRECPIDLALNIVSMQEMDLDAISEYFDDLRFISKKRRIWFYCCNRERKTLPDGTITRFSEYPWDVDDKILLDELCPWHQEYYSVVPPFYRRYDGPIRHRLARLAPPRSVNVSCA